MLFFCKTYVKGMCFFFTLAKYGICSMAGSAGKQTARTTGNNKVHFIVNIGGPDGVNMGVISVPRVFSRYINHPHQAHL